MDPDPALTIRPLTSADLAAASRVYVRAFERFVHTMLREEAGRGADLTADLLEPLTDAWVAEVDGEVAGLAWVQDPKRAPVAEDTWRVLRRHLPVRAAARAWIFNRMLHGVIVPDDRLYLDSLAVDPSYESQGVGRALLEHVIDEATGRRKAAVCLYVIDRDRRPRAIYERRGFVRVRSESPRVFQSVIGFERSDYMELALEADTPPHARARHERGFTRIGNLVNDLVDVALWRRLPDAP